MKLIVAVIRSEKLKAVQAALEMPDVYILSVNQSLGHTDEPVATGTYRGTKFQLRQSKLRLEVAVSEEIAERAIEAIVRSAYTPDFVKADEVKIVVMPMDACVPSLFSEENSIHHDYAMASSG